MDTPRAAIYTRVSLDRTGAGRSVDEQEAECRQWVDREGWNLTEVYSDNDRSASRYSHKDRPDWHRVTDALADGRIDVLVVWEISRATRDRLVWATLVEACMDRSVRLCIGGKVYDLDDPDDAFTLDLTSSLSVRESSVTRKRVQRSMAASAAKGRPHGRLAYGYRRVYDDANGQLVEQVIDQEQAAVIREAARRVLSGETPYAVAQDYNRRGIPTPRNGKGWDLTQVKRLCTNPAYVAKRVHKGKVVGDAAWPPILDDATFYALETKLTDPKRRTQRGSAVRHLLSGIATCGVCGGRIRVQKNRGFLAYLCIDGFHVSRKEDDVDAFIEAVTVARLSQPDVLELLAGDDDGDKEASAEAAEKRARLNGFYDAAAAGEVTPAALARIEARLLPEIEAAEKRARAVAAAPVVADNAGPDAADRWGALPITVRREIIDAMMTVEILPAGRGRRVFDPSSVRIVWKGQP